MGQLTVTPDVLASRSQIGLMNLPTELHIQIASYLSYPDALALKHTSRNFYSLVYTGVHLKVDWLVERFQRKLECPMEKCSFRTDEQFCNWRIRRIMERRRRHLECRRGPGGCCVIDDRTCQKKLMASWIKRPVPGEVVKKLSAWAREALIVYVFVLFLEFAWVLLARIYGNEEQKRRTFDTSCLRTLGSILMGF